MDAVDKDDRVDILERMRTRAVGTRLAAGAFILLTSLSATVEAQLDIAFDEGRVTLVARDVALDAILDEWSAAGSTRFVDATGLPSDRIHLELEDVPEADALRILLRDISGYVAAPRLDPNAGRSRFDRVILMTTSPAAQNVNNRPRRQPYPSAARAFPPAQRSPRTVQNTIGTTAADPVAERRALDRLRDLLPSPPEAQSQNRSDANQASRTPLEGPSTAPRPGMVIESPADAAPAFIRPRAVRPQADDP